MRQLVNRLGAAALALALALTLLPLAAVAAEPPFTYLVLGDSIAAGYTPDDGTGAAGTLDAPYSSHLNTLYGFEEVDSSMAVSGWTSQDLLNALTSTSDDTFAGVKLVTITVGGNDLMGALYDYLFQAHNTDPNYTGTKYDNLEAFQAALMTDSVLQQFASDQLGALISNPDSFQQLFFLPLATFRQNLGSILGKVKEKAPNATIVVTNQYNPYTYLMDQAESMRFILEGYGYGYYYTLISNLYQAFEAGCQVLNTAIQDSAAGNAVVADAYGLFAKLQQYDLNPNYQNLTNASAQLSPISVSLDFHPNEAGHQAIAQAIAQAINNLSDNVKPQVEDVSFDDLSYGETSAQVKDLTLTNNGLLPVTVQSVSCLSPYFEARMKDTGSITIAPGASAVVGTVTSVIPVDGLDAASYTASISVTVSANYTGSNTDALDLDNTSFQDVPCAGEATLKVLPLDLETIQVDVSSFGGSLIYNGQPQVPSNVSVSLQSGPELVLNRDYTLSYSNNINAGDEALITVTGIGNYTGESSHRYSIAPATLTVQSVQPEKTYDGTVQGSLAACALDGLQGSDQLTAGTDYTVAVQFDSAQAGTGKSGTATITLMDSVTNYAFADSSRSIQVPFTDGVIYKAAYEGERSATGVVSAGQKDEVILPQLPEGSQYGIPSGDPQITGLSLDGQVLRYTGSQDVEPDASYTVTIPVTGTNYEDYTVTVTLTGCRLVDPDKDQVRLSLNSALPAVGQFTTGEAVQEELSRILVEGGFAKENAVFYDVSLEFSTDGGLHWLPATLENFPQEGITVTLPYPDGTDAQYDFHVVHMFTQDSYRLGTKVGQVEEPSVKKTGEGIQVTLTGLSPVAVGWSKPQTPAAPTAPSAPAETPDDSIYYTCSKCGYHTWTATDAGYRCDHCGNLVTDKQLAGYPNVKGVYTPTAAALGLTAAPQTGDNTHLWVWIVVALVAAAALVWALVYTRGKKR